MKMSFKNPHVAAMKPRTSMPSAPKIHPSAAAYRTKVRLPDATNIGTDPAPIVPNTGKI